MEALIRAAAPIVAVGAGEATKMAAAIPEVIRVHGIGGMIPAVIRVRGIGAVIQVVTRAPGIGAAIQAVIPVPGIGEAPTQAVGILAVLTAGDPIVGPGKEEECLVA
mgnify:CR=1 FL=1